ncbi:MAG TPA: primosomal protein N', partial [Rheinheimera sp.]|nr:primosomal protein N' [Rheinheimera sp.]
MALPVPLRQHFDYLIDANAQVQVGCRVLVPFGNRKLVGIVWQLDPNNSFDSNKLKPVVAVLDTDPVLPALLC